MKYLLATFILASFAGIAVFGFLGMHGSGSMHEGCLATAAKANGVCPLGSGSLFDALFHVKVFKSFSVLIFSVIIAAVILAAGLLSKIALPLFAQLPSFSFAPVSVKKSLNQEQLLIWLSLHENSPASAAVSSRQSAIS